MWTEIRRGRRSEFYKLVNDAQLKCVHWGGASQIVDSATFTVLLKRVIDTSLSRVGIKAKLLRKG